MDIFSEIRALIGDALLRVDGVEQSAVGALVEAISVEPPRDAAHGDIATNVAMLLTKKLGKSPLDIAGELKAKLEGDPRIRAISIAKPGFINISLTAGALHDVLRAALACPDAFGRTDIGAGKRVNVEYVSTNPTGPLHVGHVRGAVFGDALANLLTYVGFDVTREYYVNDAGAQVDGLARSVYLRYLQAHGRESDLSGASYPGDYLIEIGEALRKQVGTRYLDKSEAEWLAPIRTFAVERMMTIVREDLALLGIEMDVYRSEKAIIESKKIEAVFAQFEREGLIYQGVLEPPKGKMPPDWEPREQTLFRSTEYGDDRDRALKKSDGSWTYFAPDIAYHGDKIERGFDVLIDILGADHSGYVKRMKAAVSALSENRVPLDIKIVQIVRLLKGGEPLKMSKRAGNFVLLRALVDEIGADVTRFIMLTRRNDAQLDFDFETALSQSQDNPVFYVQYAHARVKSALQKAAQMGIDISDKALASSEMSSLSNPHELALARKIAEWPRLVKSAAHAHEPHRIAFYLYELASDLHSHWARGNTEPELRFLQADDKKASQEKLALIRALSIVIANGLRILGVRPLEEMR